MVGWGVVSRANREQPEWDVRDRRVKNILLTHLLPSHFPSRASVPSPTFRIKFLDTMGCETDPHLFIGDYVNEGMCTLNWGCLDYI